MTPRKVESSSGGQHSSYCILWVNVDVLEKVIPHEGVVAFLVIPWQTCE